MDCLHSMTYVSSWLVSRLQEEMDGHDEQQGGAKGSSRDSMPG